MRIRMVSTSEEPLAGTKCGNGGGEPSWTPAGEGAPWIPVTVVLIITAINRDIETQQAWVQILALPFSSPVALPSQRLSLFISKVDTMSVSPV